jgi:hypothetical protein
MTDSIAASAALEIAPHVPALMHDALPLIDGVIGPAPEDFVVDEVPLYPQSGAGEHLYVRIEKRSYTTPAMVRAVTRAAGVDERDVGYAGLKDKHAVTRQWLSLPLKARPPSEWPLPEGIRVVEHTRHSNKLRTGHLLGNRFRITLVTEDAGALEKASATAELLRSRGLLNYFGGQRFGRGGDGLRQALVWLREGAKLHGMPRFLTKLYPSVIQYSTAIFRHGERSAWINCCSARWCAWTTRAPCLPSRTWRASNRVCKVATYTSRGQFSAQKRALLRRTRLRWSKPRSASSG